MDSGAPIHVAQQVDFWSVSFDIKIWGREPTEDDDKEPKRLLPEVRFMSDKQDKIVFCNTKRGATPTQAVASIAVGSPRLDVATGPFPTNTSWLRGKNRFLSGLVSTNTDQFENRK